MTEEIKEKIRVDTEAGAKAGQLFSALRIQAEKAGRSSLITPRDIENQREILRRKAIGPNTATQAILADMARNGHVGQYLLDDSGRITHLFFTSPKAVEIIRRNWEVFCIDTTYKTNMYGLPLFLLTGTTCLHSTYFAAYAFILNETQEDFEWVLNRFKMLLKDSDIPNPRVLITNKDIAQANAVTAVFPTAVWLLCKFHIKRNVTSYARRMLRKLDLEIDDIMQNGTNENGTNENGTNDPTFPNETEAFKALIKQFETLWSTVTDASTVEGYENAWKTFAAEFGRADRSPKLIEYIKAE